MSEPAAGQQSQEQPPFQFTIRTALTIITGASVLLSLIVGTTCIYFAGPVAVAFCFLLRWIDPAEPPPTSAA